MIDKIENTLRKILPYMLYATTTIGIIQIIYFIIKAKYSLAIDNMAFLSILWGYIFLSFYHGCKKDMSGVTEQQVNLFKKIGVWLIVTGVPLMIISIFSQ